MKLVRSAATLAFSLILFAVILNFISPHVDASICPRAACSNKCDLTGSECAPGSACTTGEQGWWCIGKESCDPALPGGIREHAYQCDGVKWVDKGVSDPTSDCGGFCGGPTPTPFSAQDCRDRPFRVEFKSTRALGPGERIVCTVKQVNSLCEPCAGLKKETQCEFGTSFDVCRTVDSDCLCKFGGGFAYTCELNGVAFTGGSGVLPPDVVSNASTATVQFTPPTGGVINCQVGNSCVNCNGNNTSCFPDCGGGTCSGGSCTSCPAAPATCQIGKSCAGQCNGNDSVCYPGCNGGTCNTSTGKCDTCSESGVTPVVPTLAQQKTITTVGPTFIPVGTGGAPAIKTQRWACLETLPCSESTSQCSGQGDAKHRVAISTGKAAQVIPNRDTYIYDCLVDSNGIQCTSGNGTIDTQTLQKNMFAQLQASYGYNLFGFFKQDGTTQETNPLRSSGNGVIGKHEWESSTSTSVGHIFFAMNQINPDEYIGTNKSTQQSTFNLEGVPFGKCLMLTYDPYGRVFDSKTLEPIQGAAVTLLKKTETGEFIPVHNTDVIGGITNPVKTGKDGSFSFRVPDGTYKISISAKGYRFPSKADELNSQYSAIYSHIYRGEEIIQKGKIVHHDIPLAPIDVKKSMQQSLNTKPQILTLNQSLNKTEKTINIEGTTTHPKATVEIYGKVPSGKSFKRTRLIQSSKADSLGKFSIIIKQGALGTDELIGDMEIKKDASIFATKTEPTRSWFSVLMTSLIQKVMGSEKETGAIIPLQPIPTELHGYAKNEKGIAIANTKVEIYLPFSNKPVAFTKTDESGYFSIGSRYLPDLPYSIEFKTTTGKIIQKTPSQFILENSR